MLIKYKDILFFGDIVSPENPLKNLPVDILSFTIYMEEYVPFGYYWVCAPG
jgi:hypothetical protein